MLIKYHQVDVQLSKISHTDNCGSLSNDQASDNIKILIKIVNLFMIII